MKLILSPLAVLVSFTAAAAVGPPPLLRQSLTTNNNAAAMAQITNNIQIIKAQWTVVATNQTDDLTAGTTTVTNFQDSAGNNLLTVHTNWAHGADQVISLSADTLITGTNATAGNVVILITNQVPGRWFTAKLTADGNPRTVSFYCRDTMTWISTNATSSGTNLLITASKTAVVCGRAWPGAGSTNITLFAVVQP